MLAWRVQILHIGENCYSGSSKPADMALGKGDMWSCEMQIVTGTRDAFRRSGLFPAGFNVALKREVIGQEWDWDNVDIEAWLFLECLIQIGLRSLGQNCRLPGRLPTSNFSVSRNRSVHFIGEKPVFHGNYAGG